jgi:hypothetical protein
MSLARGDYVTLFGDDDGLAPNYFKRMHQIIGQFAKPEVIYSVIYQLMHPGVAPWADTVWPESRSRLSASERKWADAVEMLLALKLKKRSQSIIKSRVIPDLLRRISPCEFEPMHRFCDRANFSRLLDVCEALESEALH